MSKEGTNISSSRNQSIVITSHGIEIQHKGKPISRASVWVGCVYLVIDCSGSMAGDKLNQAKKGAVSFAKDALSKGYSIGLIQFDSSTSQLSEPTREILVIERCVAGMVVGGSTNMAAAIRLAHRQLKGKTGLLAMVIITDGMPDNVDDSLKAGQESKKAGIDIIAIGTDDADGNFLKKLASRSDLGVKVNREHFEQSITSSANLLESGK